MREDTWTGDSPKAGRPRKANVSRTDAHTPLWVRNLDPNFNEYQALQQGLRICACYMCYDTEQIKHKRSVIRANERQLIRDLVKTRRDQLDDVDTHIPARPEKWIAYRVYRKE